MLPDQKTNAIDSILRSSWKSPWKYGKIPVFGKKSNDWLGDSACINTLSSSETTRLGYGNIRQHFPNRFWLKKQWKYVFLGKLELWVLDLVTSILVYFKSDFLLVLYSSIISNLSQTFYSLSRLRILDCVTDCITWHCKITKRWYSIPFRQFCSG